MTRKKYSKEEKAKIAIASIKGQKTVSELSSEFGVHGSQINSWKKQLLDGAADVFSKKKDNSEQKHAEERDCLFQKVGQLQIEVDWLKKLLGLEGMSIADKRSAIDPTQDLSIARQCKLESIVKILQTFAIKLNVGDEKLNQFG